MPISSEIMKHVPRTAPEGLIGWTINKNLLEQAALVYEQEWDWDTGIEALLEERVRKVRIVKVTCSECQQSTYMNYAPHAGESYGFFAHYEYTCGGEVIGSGDPIECPHCGAKCLAKKAAEIGRGRFTSDEAHVMSACLADMPGPDGKRPLALIGWRVRREADRYGYDHYKAEPLDAYVFDGAEAAKLTGSVNSYSGTAGYFLAIKREWGMPKSWSCDWDYSTEIFGLTPELVAASSVERSRLDEYMQQDPKREMRKKYPIIYLRLWQKHPQTENLVHQGAGYILDALIDKYTNRLDWRDNKRGEIELPELDWSDARPAQILRLDKEEFRAMRAQCWDAYHWHVFITAKRVGDRMAIPEDIVLLHQYGGEDIESIIGLAPVGKCLRYLMKQYQVIGVELDEARTIAMEFENDETDPEGEIWDDRIFGGRELADYWRMAETCGWNMNDPAVKWPKNLMEAHDRATKDYAFFKKKKQKKLFEATYKQLSELTYASGEFLIRPARSQKELSREGNTLHHCVGSYGEQHVSGKPIFFVRRAAEPDKPYFTLQFDVTKRAVIQNRGRYNCARTPGVEAFEAEWIRWVLKGAPRNKDGSPVGAKPVKQIKKAHDKKKENAA